METYVIITSVSVVVLLQYFILRAARRNRNRGESKLNMFEYPGTFKKQDIEMVTATYESEEKNKPDS